MASSILSRKRDLLYLVYFSIHIPVMFLIDLSALYSSWLEIPLTKTLMAHSKDHYRDYLLTPREGETVPGWFMLYIWLELFLHVPISFWSIGGLVRDSPKVPLVLLIYSIETVVSTATCIAEYFSWTDITFQEKLDLTTLYGPYLALAVFMFVDMTGRLNGMIDKASAGKIVVTAPEKKLL